MAFTVLINFSNPYIFRSEIMHSLQEIKQIVDCEIYIIITNYYLPATIEKELEDLRRKDIIMNFIIMNVYSDYEFPSGRPIHRLHNYMASYQSFRKLIKEKEFNLVMMHSTSEISDRYLLKSKRVKNSHLILLQPTFPGDIHTNVPISERIRNSRDKNLLQAVRNRIIYTLESLNKSAIMLYLSGSITNPLSWTRDLTCNNVFDIVLSSTIHDMTILKTRIKGRDFQCVNFSPKVRTDVETDKRVILVLLPYMDGVNSRKMFSLLNNEFTSFSGIEQFDELIIRPHPRSDEKCLADLSDFFRRFQIKYLIDVTGSTDLFEQISGAERIVVFKSSSTFRFVKKYFPGKVINVVSDSNIGANDESDTATVYFSEKIIQIVLETGVNRENFGDGAR
jgi:hypothetical protein